MTRPINEDVIIAFIFVCVSAWHKAKFVWFPITIFLTFSLIFASIVFQYWPPWSLLHSLFIFSLTRNAGHLHWPDPSQSFSCWSWERIHGEKLLPSTLQESMWMPSQVCYFDAWNVDRSLVFTGIMEVGYVFDNEPLSFPSPWKTFFLLSTSNRELFWMSVALCCAYNSLIGVSLSLCELCVFVFVFTLAKLS